MGHLKILIADDEPHILRLVQVNLEKQGWTVIQAKDGREAQEKIEGERPDLVILDLEMPRFDGFQVLEWMRGIPETQELPVIVLTGKEQDDGDVLRCLVHNTSMYLTKPFNPSELVGFVKIVMGCLSE